MSRSIKVTLLVLAALTIAGFLFSTSRQTVASPPSNCQNLPSETQLKGFLKAAQTAGGTVGGLFEGTRMWGAVVNRDGEICTYTTSTDDPTQVWPGSQAIAKAKAYTGNAFSLDTLALSTARLYTFTQPGHSLWSLGQSNLFDPKALAAPSGGSGGKNQIAGGLIFFGGGVPLYNSQGKIIGALGVSGDTSCADHEIAKRVRNLAGLNPPGGALVDDITYSSADGASPFTHPLCPNTFRNGVFIGNEQNASGY
ncbi:MAG TPA: heme-binding protein [Pyrinomonadaceae bacterium]|nr:heme-binding protein [Pyrinomonadaceae bacterium]